MVQAILHRTCVKLRSAIADEAVVRLDFTGDLEEMLDALEDILLMLEEAEMHGDRTGWLQMLERAETHGDPTAWLQMLERAEMDGDPAGWLQEVTRNAYTVTDLVDELQDMRPPADATMTGNSATLVVVEVKDQLIHLKRQWHSYILPAIIHKKQMIDWTEDRGLDVRERLTVPFFEETSVFGRGQDEQRIVAVLLSAGSNIKQGCPNCTILPIFGLPGSGKTTLAQMVFNDDAHPLLKYNFRVWVHVSPELDFHGICKSILRQVVSREEKEEINVDPGSNQVVGMERIMERLHELLNGNNVLFVLDDLWEEDSHQLQLLKSMLNFLGDKVDVIVTTCNEAIARNICTVEPYKLNPLDEDACWEIIKKSIPFEEDEELERIGREIARMCHGQPLAARAFASKLHSRDPTRWEEVMREDMYDVFSGAPLTYRSPLSTFELSYSFMPRDLRLFFAYFVTFTIGHDIAKDDLIHQWIALDLTEPSERLSDTHIADQYITWLLDMSFLQTAKPDPAKWKDDEGAILFTMHYLAHASPRLLKESECIDYRIIKNWRWEFDDQYSHYTRALSCVGCSKVEFKDDLFSSTGFLRVLKLTESSVQKLPDSICELRKLRYLKISKFSGLVTLPKSFGNLINVFHIDLSGCSGLVNLPESFRKLVRLVHINLSGCSGLLTLPESFENLISLVHINLSGCYGLVNLSESFGKLTSLVHVNLSGCYGLVTLPESFVKLTSLVHVNLSGCYGLVTLPESFGKLTSLVHVNLSGCYGLVTLPESFGKLTSLVHVNLSGCYGLVTLSESFGKLTSLVHVNMSGCFGLVTLPCSIGRLIKLFHIDLSGCSSLINLPESFGKLILLVHVNLSGCSGLVTLPESFGDLVNLSHLDLSRCHALAEIPEPLQKLGKLVHLDLSFWSCFERIGIRLGGLTNLEHLNLSHPCCHLAQQRSHLQGLKDGLCKLTRLRYLNLSMCLNPIFYYHQSQEDFLQYIADCLGGLSSLENLDLSHNTFLLDLPDLGELDRLHRLNLSGCIRLKKIGEMQSLKFIALRNCRGLESCHFVVRADDDAPHSSSSLVQLEDVDCQELQISYLEKVRSTQEARRIRLAEKQKLEKLKLSWTLDSIRSVEDSALLGELTPPYNVQCLEINGYDGTCLQEYLGDLTSLRELKIVYCKQLKSLPDSIQKLTNLKDLSISDCPELETWCQLEETKKMLAHIPNKNYEEHGSASRPEIEDDCRSVDEVEAA